LTIFLGELVIYVEDAKEDGWDEEDPKVGQSEENEVKGGELLRGGEAEEEEELVEEDEELESAGAEPATESTECEESEELESEFILLHVCAGNEEKEVSEEEEALIESEASVCVVVELTIFLGELVIDVEDVKEDGWDEEDPKVESEENEVNY